MKKKALSLIKYIFVVGVFSVSLSFVMPIVINLFNLEGHLSLPNTTRYAQILFTYKNIFGNLWNIQILFGLLYIIIYIKMYIDIKIADPDVELLEMLRNEHCVIWLYFISFAQIFFGISVGPFLIKMYSGSFRMSLEIVSGENVKAYASYMNLLENFWIYSSISGIIVFMWSVYFYIRLSLNRNGKNKIVKD